MSVAAIRWKWKALRLEPPFFVIADPLGKRIRFAADAAEVLTLAKNARHGVLVVEVRA